MKSLGLACLMSTVAHADPTAYVEGGAVLGSDFGAGTHDHFELGGRGALGLDLAGIAGVFVSYRGMGDVDAATSGTTAMDLDTLHHHVHAWDAGLRGYLPLPLALGFAELSVTRATVEFDATFSTLPGEAGVRWGVGARVGAIVPLLHDDHLGVGIGAAIGYGRYVAGDDLGETSAVTVDAFVRIDVH